MIQCFAAGPDLGGANLAQQSPWLSHSLLLLLLLLRVCQSARRAVKGQQPLRFPSLQSERWGERNCSDPAKRLKVFERFKAFDSLVKVKEVSNQQISRSDL